MEPLEGAFVEAVREYSQSWLMPVRFGLCIGNLGFEIYQSVRGGCNCDVVWSWCLEVITPWEPRSIRKDREMMNIGPLAGKWWQKRYSQCYYGKDHYPAPPFCSDLLRR